MWDNVLVFWSLGVLGCVSVHVSIVQVDLCLSESDLLLYVYTKKCSCFCHKCKSEVVCMRTCGYN